MENGARCMDAAMEGRAVLRMVESSICMKKAAAVIMGSPVSISREVSMGMSLAFDSVTTTGRFFGNFHRKTEELQPCYNIMLPLRPVCKAKKHGADHLPRRGERRMECRPQTRPGIATDPTPCPFPAKLRRARKGLKHRSGAAACRAAAPFDQAPPFRGHRHFFFKVPRPAPARQTASAWLRSRSNVVSERRRSVSALASG